MASPRPSAAHASVAFLRIAHSGHGPITEQVRFKERLEESISSSLGMFREDERILLEATNGVAVVVLANPLAALEFAWRIASKDRELPLAIGLTHGPVRAMEGHSVVHGDALAAAEAIAGLASEGNIAASRDFREALSRAAPAAAACFASAGTVVDSTDRPHELFQADERSFGRGRRRLLGMAGAAAAVILTLGIVARFVLPGLEPPGKVLFDVKPSGDVFVNGALKGTSPPLKSLQLAAGTHTIEVRNPRFPPLVTMVTLAPGEEVALKHTFAAPRPAQPAKPGWQRFLDQFK